MLPPLHPNTIRPMEGWYVLGASVFVNKYNLKIHIKSRHQVYLYDFKDNLVGCYSSFIKAMNKASSLEKAYRQSHVDLDDLNTKFNQMYGQFL